MHGAGGGAPKGRRNGKFVHGAHTNETRAELAASRRIIASAIAAMRGIQSSDQEPAPAGKPKTIEQKGSRDE